MREGVLGKERTDCWFKEQWGSLLFPCDLDGTKLEMAWETIQVFRLLDLAGHQKAYATGGSWLTAIAQVFGTSMHI